MMADAFLLLLRCGLWGMLPGFLYAATRSFPIKALRDLLVIPGLMWGYLQIAFAVCQGDIRGASLMAYFLGMLLGWKGAEALLGRVFQRFWVVFCKICALPLVPLKIFFQFAKILVASGRKMVTILWSHHVVNRPVKNKTGRKGQEERNRGRQRKSDHRMEIQ